MDTENSSGIEQFQAAVGKVEEAKAEIEEFRDDLQTWLNGLPMDSVFSSLANKLRSARALLDSCLYALEEAIGYSTEFPKIKISEDFIYRSSGRTCLLCERDFSSLKSIQDHYRIIHNKVFTDEDDSYLINKE